jgi:Zn-dependent protease
MTFVADVFHSLYFLFRGAIDALLGRNRKRYVNEIEIDAPIETVWNTISSRSVVFEGSPRIEITMSPREGYPDILEGHMSVGERRVAMAYREVELRPPEALLVEILKEGSGPGVAPGQDYFIACKCDRQPNGTRLTTVHELTHDEFLGRFLIPLGARLNARRLRDHCEALAGSKGKREGSKVGAAIVTGVLTYASFMYLFDWHFAALLLVLLVIHEAGHAVAMRAVDLPVQGIYFIPFFGGVAVAAAPHRSEAERGFVALMGPGFSLLTTGAFVGAAYLTNEPLFEHLAFLSAILNGLNLAPVLPLDGGHVVDSALSNSDPEFAAIINILSLFVGVGVSVYFEWYMLTALLLITAPWLFKSAKRPRRTEPITEASRNWLVAGYLATVGFYVAIVAHYMKFGLAPLP